LPCPNPARRASRPMSASCPDISRPCARPAKPRRRSRRDDPAARRSRHRGQRSPGTMQCDRHRPRRPCPYPRQT
jgi:hypothetical protein